MGSPEPGAASFVNELPTPRLPAQLVSPNTKMAVNAGLHLARDVAASRLCRVGQGQEGHTDHPVLPHQEAGSRIQGVAACVDRAGRLQLSSQ